MVPLAVLFHAPAAVVLIGLSMRFALLAASGSPRTESAQRLARRCLSTSAAVSLVLAAVLGVVDLDWVHHFWSVQIPLVVVFLGSGPLMASMGDRSVWRFPAFVAAFALLPLVALELLPPAGGRNTGEPTRHLVELLRWGFGGTLPECLAPRVQLELARGVGHLQREVTVPLGSMLVGAWLWIAWVGLAIGARLLASSRARRIWSAVAPALVGAFLLFVPGGATLGAFDPRFFGPDSARSSGIWESDPEVLRSFGPVLGAATVALVIFALLSRVPSSRLHPVATPTPSVPTGRGDRRRARTRFGPGATP